MKISTFFKILNRKIRKYDEMTSNPFKIPQTITLIWVEEKEFVDEYFTENMFLYKKHPPNK